MIRWALLLVLATQAMGYYYCDFQCSDRVGLREMPDNCPYFEPSVIATTTYNKSILVSDPVALEAHLETTIEHITTINGSLGWCGLYSSPWHMTEREYCGTLDLVTPYYRYFGPFRQLIVTFPLPWCVFQSAFGMCVAERRSPFHSPSVIYNRRPLPIASCNASTVASPSTHEPPLFPLWDKGGAYRGTTSVYIDDSCVALLDYSPSLYNQLYGNTIVNYMFAAKDASATFTPATSTSGKLVVSSFISGCNTTYLGGNMETNYVCSACNNLCSKAPQITCNGTRNTPIANPGLVVRLACSDPTFGYVFQVTNGIAANTWIDWTVNDTMSSGARVTRVRPSTYPSASRYRPIATDITMGKEAYPIWPGAMDGHGSASSTYFYIATFARLTTTLEPVNASDPNTTYVNITTSSIQGPFEISIYAGIPDYYVSNHKIAALVEYVNMTARLNIAALKIHTSINWTTLERVTTKFVGDLPRQVILLICSNTTFRAEAQPWVLAPLNLATMCTALNGLTNSWPGAWSTLRVSLGFSSTAADPVPTCSCSNTLRTPCGNEGIAGLVKFGYDYTPLPPLPPLNFNLEPVCRVVGNPFPNLTNVPPPPELNNTGYLTALMTDAAPYRDRLIPPYFITTPSDPSLSTVTYSTAPMGVLWRINNMDGILTNPAVEVRWATAFYTPPSGPALLDGSEPVGYDPLQTVTNIASSKSYWLFSRTTSPHKLLTLMRVPCITPADCAERVPTDDPISIWAANSYVGLAPTPSTLPICQCYVNAPCNAYKFQFTTDNNVDVSQLLPIPGTTPPVIDISIVTGCVPSPEICNGLDDDCNSLVDDVAGLNLPCGYNIIGSCTMGTLQCNVTAGQLVCTGATLPATEKCGGVDYDCDGIASNVPGLGQTCGSDVAPCVPGILVCSSTPGSDPICSGAILPINEICGNGIDDDCNGLIDDGCAGLVTLPPPPPTYPPHAPVPIPTQNTLPALPPLVLSDLINTTLGKFGISLPSVPSYDPWVFLLALPILVFFLGACLFSATRAEGVQVIRRSGDEFTLHRAQGSGKSKRD